jgi:hypothetical protein
VLTLFKFFHRSHSLRHPLATCLYHYLTLYVALYHNSTGLGGSVQVKVHRDTIVEDAFLGLRQAGSRLKGRVKVEFIGEAGIDGGGLFKEFIDSFLKAAFNPSLGLFCPTSEQLLVPNPLSSQNPLPTIAFATSEREGSYLYSHLPHLQLTHYTVTFHRVAITALSAPSPHFPAMFSILSHPICLYSIPSHPILSRPVPSFFDF